MNAPQTQQQTAQQWLTYVLQDLRENLTRLRINDTGTLLASVQGALVAAAGGDVERIRLAYAAYGMFVDMGVGRGMGKGVRRDNSAFAKIRDERGRLFIHARTARPWASKVLGKQARRLSILLSEQAGDIIVAMLQNSLPTSVEINL